MNEKARPGSLISAGNLILDLDKVEGRIEGRRVCITHQEFEILVLLAERKNSIVNQDTLCRAIWGHNGPKEVKRLAVIVSRLREQLADSYPFVIETVRSRGYGLASVIQRGPMIKSIDPSGMHDWHSDAYVNEWINTQQEGPRDDLMRKLVNLIPFDPEAEFRVLDVGGGYGPLSKLVMETFPNATIVMHDYSEPMLSEARRRLNHLSDTISFVRGDLLSDEWSAGIDGEFDVVVSTNAIHNVRFPKRIHAIYKEIFSRIKPGGAFIINDRLAANDRITSIEKHRDMMQERWQYYEQTGSFPDMATLHPVTKATLTAASPLPPSSTVEEEPATLFNQMKWLTEMGFKDVECFWRDNRRALIASYR